MLLFVIVFFHFSFPIFTRPPSPFVSGPDHLQHIKIPFFSLQRIARRCLGSYCIPSALSHTLFLSFCFGVSLPPQFSLFSPSVVVLLALAKPWYLTAPTCRAHTPAVVHTHRFFGCRAGPTLPKAPCGGNLGHRLTDLLPNQLILPDKSRQPQSPCIYVSECWLVPQGKTDFNVPWRVLVLFNM